MKLILLKRLLLRNVFSSKIICWLQIKLEIFFLPLKEETFVDTEEKFTFVNSGQTPVLNKEVNFSNQRKGNINLFISLIKKKIYY